MAVKVQQVLEILEQIAPPELACSWDNVGLLVDAGRPVTSIMTALDITANPKQLKIMELEGAQLPRVLDDPKVDVAIISTTYIQQTGLSPVHDSVFIEDKNSPYVNIVVTREDNKDAENVKEFIQSYQSPEVAKAAETIFNGGAVPGW